MLVTDFLYYAKLNIKNRGAFYKNYRRNPKVRHKKMMKEIKNYFKRTSKAELKKAWDEVSN